MLALLKAVRDHSTLNTRTPVISAGLADSGPTGKRPGQKLDGVSAPATLQFLQQNGMGKLVDGYGVHFYPSNLHPSAPVTARITGLGERALLLCTRAKPCWLTERGIPDSQLSCPIHDETRVRLLIGTERQAFQTFVSDGKLVAAISTLRSADGSRKGRAATYIQRGRTPLTESGGSSRLPGASGG